MKRANCAYLSHAEKLEIWRLREDEKLSHRAIAKLVGCGKTAVSRCLSRERPTVAIIPPPPPADTTILSPIAFQATKLVEVAKDIQFTRQRGSVHVLPQLHRLHLQIHTDLHALKEAREEENDAMDMEALMASIVDTVATLPPLVRHQIHSQLEACERAEIINIDERRGHGEQ